MSAEESESDGQPRGVIDPTIEPDEPDEPNVNNREQADQQSYEEPHEDPSLEKGAQMAFSDDGEIESKNETTGVRLSKFGLEIEAPKPESRYDSPQASSLLADDRPDDDSSGNPDSEQANLFVDVDEQQQTLTGESAHNKCLFEDDA